MAVNKSKRNRYAGKSTGTSKTARFYKDNKESRDKRRLYNKEYNKSAREKKKRAALNRHNHKAGTYGNGDKKDASHKNGKIVGMEAQSKNRARNGKGSTKPGRKRTTKKKK